DRFRFRFAQCPQAGRPVKMPAFIKQRRDSFLPTRISQRPRFQHPVRVNNVGPTRLAMPSPRGNGAVFPQAMLGQEPATHSHHQASRRNNSALLTSYYLHWRGITGNNSWQLRQLSNARLGADLGKSDKTVCKDDGPEHQEGDVPAEVESQTNTKHEQHETQQRLPLFPPADKQTGPKRHQYSGRHRTKDLAKV